MQTKRVVFGALASAWSNGSKLQLTVDEKVDAAGTMVPTIDG